MVHVKEHKRKISSDSEFTKAMVRAKWIVVLGNISVDYITSPPLGQDRVMVRQNFVRFFLNRFKSPNDSGYAIEWAQRFNKGTEWFHADGKSQAVLLKTNPKKYKAYKRGDYDD